MQPVDHPIFIKNILFSDFLEIFILIWNKIFTEFISVYIITFLGILFICLFNKNNKIQDFKIISLVVFNTFIFIISYFICFSYIFLNYEIPQLLTLPKYYYTYFAILLFQCFVVWGYLFYVLRIKKFFIFNVFFVICVLVSNYGYWHNYLSSVSNQRIKYIKSVKEIYDFEKSIIAHIGEESIIVTNQLDFNENYFKHVLLKSFIILHYPDFENVKTVVVDNNLQDMSDKNDFDESISFSNNLKHKIIRNSGKYNFMLEKFKEEDNKTYYHLIRY